MSENKVFKERKNLWVMFDHFAKEKSDFLNKNDKSRKGCLDKDIKETINIINSKKGYYTTSSCSGRIVLLEMKSKRKDECNWVFAKHHIIKFNEIKESLKNYQNKKNNQKNPIWFKQQPIILHVACRNLDATKKLLDATRKIFKRSGIISVNEKRVIVEIIGNERLETVIADKDFVMDENSIKKIIKYANENFAENKKKSDKLFKIIKCL